MTRKMNKLLFTLAIIVMIGSSAALVHSLYGDFVYWRDARVARHNAATMQEVFAELIESDEEFPPEDDTYSAFISPVIIAREITGNADIVAYIHVDGTNISHAVLQGEDNEFYLYRDINRQPNVNGSIFLDYANSPYFDDRNSIIYGHNMRNGEMFHNIRYFMNLDFFQENRYITIITEHEILTYEIFSAFSTRVDFEYIQVDFYDDDDFLRLLSEVQRRCIHGTESLLGVDDRILILSTCTNVEQDTRIVVAAFLQTHE